MLQPSVRLLTPRETTSLLARVARAAAAGVAPMAAVLRPLLGPLVLAAAELAGAEVSGLPLEMVGGA